MTHQAHAIFFVEEHTVQFIKIGEVEKKCSAREGETWMEELNKRRGIGREVGR